MMGGPCLMVNDKMYLGINGDTLMARTDPAGCAELLAEPGARAMDFTGRPMRGFLFIDAKGIDADAALDETAKRRTLLALPPATTGALRRPPNFVSQATGRSASRYCLLKPLRCAS